jgi:hypothetical protein
MKLQNLATNISIDSIDKITPVTVTLHVYNSWHLGILTDF